MALVNSIGILKLFDLTQLFLLLLSSLMEYVTCCFFASSLIEIILFFLFWWNEILLLLICKLFDGKWYVLLSGKPSDDYNTFCSFARFLRRHLYQPKSHQSSVQSISQSVSQRVSDKARRWSDSGLIERYKRHFACYVAKTWGKASSLYNTEYFYWYSRPSIDAAKYPDEWG